MKPYVKPELFFESYELSQRVAACGWDLQHDSKETCEAAWDMDLQNNHIPGVSVFTETPRCALVPGNNSMCYQNGAGDFGRVFQS